MNNIRTAKVSDLHSIIGIYNQAVSSKFETADTIIIDPKDKLEWFNNHKKDVYPIFVYEEDNMILGWISISPYRMGRKALRYTVEISYFIDKDFKRQGIGSKLIEYVIIKSKELNYKSLFAIILDRNDASIKLLERFGFVKWGYMPDIADFNGVECGHVYYGLRI